MCSEYRFDCFVNREIYQTLYISHPQDKAYEEGIVNDLRALELRLECELAEEEKKLWPADKNE